MVKGYWALWVGDRNFGVPLKRVLLVGLYVECLGRVPTFWLRLGFWGQGPICLKLPVFIAASTKECECTYTAARPPLVSRCCDREPETEPDPAQVFKYGLRFRVFRHLHAKSSNLPHCICFERTSCLLVAEMADSGPMSLNLALRHQHQTHQTPCVSRG